MSTATPAHDATSTHHQLALIGIAVVGAGVLGVGAFMMPRQALSEALAAAVFAVTMPLGVALFAAICVAVGARWWHPLHAIFEEGANFIFVPALAVAAVLLLGTGVIYPWMDPEVAATHIVHMKHAWLDLPFFLSRALIVLLAWIVMSRKLTKAISRAFAMPSPSATKTMARTAVVFAIIFALTISVAWWDWLMSLEPEWFSTMQGVYGFSSTLLGGVALVTLLALSRERRGMLELTNAQAHDLGKMLFAFSFFWGYIWFCQFMLIWYANIPEEGGWFIHRLGGGWTPYFLLNGVLGVAAPFVMLLSAATKKSRPRLRLVAWIVLAGRAMDIWMSVAPSLDPEPSPPVFWLATLGLIVAGTALVEGWRRRRSEEVWSAPFSEARPRHPLPEHLPPDR